MKVNVVKRWVGALGIGLTCVMGQGAFAATVTAPGYAFESGGDPNLLQVGYSYSMVAESGGFPGSSDVHYATAGVRPGIASASTSFSCFDVPERNYCGGSLPRAEAKLRYRIEATVTEAFYAQTGLTNVDVPMFYNWNVYTEVFEGSGVADAAVWFGRSNIVYQRSAGGASEQEGTHYFKNGTTVRLEAVAQGNAVAVADPFGGVDPNWEYAHLAHLIDINTNPVPVSSIAASSTLAPVPLPASGFLILGGLAGLGALRARSKAA